MKKLFLALAVLVSALATPNVNAQSTINLGPPNQQVKGILPVVNGGTGSNSTAQALSNLGAWQLPSFGSGAPVAACNSLNQNAVYYNTLSTPYVTYVCNNNAWVQFGGTGSGNGCTLSNPSGYFQINNSGTCAGEFIDEGVTTANTLSLIDKNMNLLATDTTGVGYGGLSIKSTSAHTLTNAPSGTDGGILINADSQANFVAGTGAALKLSTSLANGTGTPANAGGILVNPCASLNSGLSLGTHSCDINIVVNTGAQAIASSSAINQLSTMSDSFIVQATSALTVPYTGEIVLRSIKADSTANTGDIALIADGNIVLDSPNVQSSHNLCVDANNILTTIGCASGSGTISGSGTAGYLAAWTGTTALGNTHIDDGVSTAGTITITEPVSVITGSGVGGGFSGNEGTAPTAGFNIDTVWADATSHRIKMNPNNAGALYIIGTSAGNTANHCLAFASNGIDVVDSGNTCNAFTGSVGTNFVPVGTAGGLLTNSHLDDGNTTVGVLTSSEPVAVNVSGGQGGGFTGTEGTSISGASSIDALWADSTAHRFKMNPNNTGALNIVGISASGTSGHCLQLSSNGLDVIDSGATDCTLSNQNGIYNAIRYNTSNNGLVAAEAAGGVGAWTTAYPGYTGTDTSAFAAYSNSMVEDERNAGRVLFSRNSNRQPIIGDSTYYPFAQACLFDIRRAATGQESNVCADQLTYELGPGVNIGNGGGWTVGINNNRTLVSYTPGIAQIDNTTVYSHADQDFNSYQRWFSVLQDTGSGGEQEEVSAQTFNEEPYLFTGTIATGGTGATTLTTTPTSPSMGYGANGQFAGGMLIDTTDLTDHPTIIAFNNPATNYPGGTITTSTTHTASTAWGLSSTSVAPPTNITAGTSSTVTVTLASGSFSTSGEVCIAGNVPDGISKGSGWQEAAYSATALSGGTQTLTFTALHPFPVNSLYVQGSCYAAILDADAQNSSGHRSSDIAMTIFGAPDTTHYWYGIASGQGMQTIPYTFGLTRPSVTIGTGLSLSRTSNVVTLGSLNINGVGYQIHNVNVTVSSCSDTTFNGTYGPTTLTYSTGAYTITYPQTAANSTATGCTVATVANSGASIHPMAQVLSVTDPAVFNNTTPLAAVDGYFLVEPNTVAWAGKSVEQPHGGTSFNGRQWITNINTPAYSSPYEVGSRDLDLEYNGNGFTGNGSGFGFFPLTIYYHQPLSSFAGYGGQYIPGYLGKFLGPNYGFIMSQPIQGGSAFFMDCHTVGNCAYTYPVNLFTLEGNALTGYINWQPSNGTLSFQVPSINFSNAILHGISPGLVSTDAASIGQLTYIALHAPTFTGNHANPSGALLYGDQATGQIYESGFNFYQNQFNLPDSYSVIRWNNGGGTQLTAGGNNGYFGVETSSGASGYFCAGYPDGSNPCFHTTTPSSLGTAIIDLVSQAGYTNHQNTLQLGNIRLSQIGNDSNTTFINSCGIGILSADTTTACNAAATMQAGAYKVGTNLLPFGSENVTFSATPTFNNSYDVSEITLTANITSFTLGSGFGGEHKTLTFCQDATGSHTVVAPSNVRGFFSGNSGQIGLTASTCSSQSFRYSSVQGKWLADGPGVINE